MKNTMRKLAGASFLLGCVFMVSCASSSQSGCYYSDANQINEALEIECPTSEIESESTKVIYKKITVTGE